MQRRAAAGYGAVFLVVGILAFSLIATATPPTLTFQNPDHRLGDETNATIGGTEYNVSVEAELSEGDGEGGGGELVRSATLVTVNDSARLTATWANGSTVTYRETDWTVRVTDDSTVQLVEELDRTAILEDDPSVENETQTIDGVTYVVRITDDGEGELIPAEEYFPEPATETIRVGDTVQYEDESATVANVTGEGALLSWTGRETTEIGVSEGANVTIGGTTYYAHFPDNETLVLSDNFERVEAHEAAAAQQKKHTDGLWGITLVSGTGLVLLVGFSFLPSRY